MPDRNKDRIGAAPEFEVAYYTKELGKTLQREMLRKQLARLSDTSTSTNRHGEDLAPALDTAPPPQDRTG